MRVLRLAGSVGEGREGLEGFKWWKRSGLTNRPRRHRLGRFAGLADNVRLHAFISESSV